MADKCAMCGGPLEEKTPERESKMQAELKALFGDVPVEKCVIVCDDCWQKVRPDKVNGGRNRKRSSYLT